MSKMPMPFSNPTTYAGHGGIDFGQPMGQPIPAITEGTITFAAWWNDNAGWTKTITRGDGLQIMHCHLNNLAGLAVGARVNYGQDFAYVGTTGHSTGPHLHLEMWKGGVPQDEWQWMDKGTWIGKGSTAGGDSKPFPTPTPPPANGEQQEDDQVNVVLYLYVPTNSLILADHLNMTLRDLGNKETFERNTFSTKPYVTVDEPFWTNNFASFRYITKAQVL